MKKQSALSRIASGSAASWAAILVNLVTTLLTTPIFLSKWSPGIYGAWLVFQAVSGIVQIVDLGHQTFLQNEFLRIGAKHKELLERIFWASFPAAACVALLKLAAVARLAREGVFGRMAGVEYGSRINRDLSILLMVHIVVWVTFGSIGGIATRFLAAFGYFSRFSWWNVLMQASTAAIPLLLVWKGGGLVVAGVGMLVGVGAVNVVLLIDIVRLFRRERISYRAPSVALGCRNLLRSFTLTIKAALDMIRQTGARLILSPLSGASEMAAFATMRTGANVANQGLSTVTNPLMPELMRYLNDRDQGRVEAAFGAVWVVVAGLMAPAVVAIQWCAPALFVSWTRGKMQFDPVLFALLSTGVLIYAVAQPAMAVVQGNNLLRIQLILSALAGGGVIFGMLALVPHFGIRGAAIALAVAELVSAVGNVRAASVWLSENQLRWPVGSFSRVVGSVAISIAGILGMAICPRAQLGIAIICLIGQMVCFAAYWAMLPEVVRNRVAGLLQGRVPQWIILRIIPNVG